MQLCKGSRADVRVRGTRIHVLMYVCILTKVCDQKRDDWDMHAGTHICMQLWKGGGAEVWSRVDMLTCTDICTHSNRSFSSWQKGGLFIVDYSKQSSVHQVKYKLVTFTHTFQFIIAYVVNVVRNIFTTIACIRKLPVLLTSLLIQVRSSFHVQI